MQKNELDTLKIDLKEVFKGGLFYVARKTFI